MKMPERSQILQSVDQFQKRDPELHRELWRKAAEPVDDEAVFPVARKAAEILEEYAPVEAAEESMRTEHARAGTAVTAPVAFGARGVGVAPLVDSAVTAYERRVAETIVRPSARPVLAIRDNRVTTEFLGPDSEIWRHASTAPRPSSTSSRRRLAASS